MSGSAFQLLMAQGWLSIWTTLITIISVFFFTYIQDGRSQAIDWSVANFMVGCSTSLHPPPLHPFQYLRMQETTAG